MEFVLRVYTVIFLHDWDHCLFKCITISRDGRVLIKLEITITSWFGVY